MRLLVPLLLLASLAGVEPPSLTRLGATSVPVLGYDLAATAPWMPVLWERLALTLPAGATGCRISATLVVPSGYGRNGTDLLSLRDGYRCILAGTSFAVGGLAGTWSGAVADDTPLSATFATMPTTTEVLLLLKQLHYANLGGLRTLDKRRLEVRVDSRVGGTWLASAPLLVDLRPVNADQPPRLRCDDLAVVQGADQPWAPLAWYDGNHTADQLTWQITASTGSYTFFDGTGHELTDAFKSGPQPLSRLLLDPPLLAGLPPGGLGQCTVTVSCAAGSTQSTFSIAVVAAAGELYLLGDLPFAITGATTVRLHPSRSDAKFDRCTVHPADPLGALLLAPKSVKSDNGVLLVELDPAGYIGKAFAGCLVFTAGGQEWRLPYRIALPTGWRG